jgi:FkbM family methyltransferase
MKNDSTSVFDIPAALQIVEARQAAVQPLLLHLQNSGLRSVADVGCGVGRFSSFLDELGFSVFATDGREDNVREARARYPQIQFQQANVEAEEILSFGTFDIIFCMGLLYHLENPLLALRRLRAINSHCLILESMCIPEERPWMALQEEPRHDNQSLTDVAFYPSEGCLTKMLYRAGYGYVYRLVALPDHDDFRDTPTRRRRRTVLFASLTPVNSAEIMPLVEPSSQDDLWAKPAPAAPLTKRASAFLKKPRSQKLESFYLRWNRYFPRIPIPIQLPFGAWWLLRDDGVGRSIRQGTYEPAEMAFVSRFLRPGMTVLDIGAHHGMYSLLASRRVGPTGRVVAFEPSPRERQALRRHLQLNRAGNVDVEEFAVGDSAAEAELFVAELRNDGCNSLRPPVVAAESIPVHVVKLDDWLPQCKLPPVDFVKMDVEGGELAALQGASASFQAGFRPVILAEVQDVRTEPWGYPAREIIRFLERYSYRWFSLKEDGSVRPLEAHRITFEDNLIACPEERLEALRGNGFTSP